MAFAQLKSSYRMVKESVQRYYWTRIARDEFRVSLYRWKDDLGDLRHRLDYPLSEESSILDIGGFRGDFAAAIHCKYGARILVVEPVPEFAQSIRARFSNNPRIEVCNIGLSDGSGSETIHMSAESSSIVRPRGRPARVILQTALEFFAEHNLMAIDLMKVNIEGGEYALLEHMGEKDLLHRIGFIQVQFHNFVQDAERRRGRIKDILSETHTPMWDYPFVWESWRRNDLPVHVRESTRDRT